MKKEFEIYRAGAFPSGSSAEGSSRQSLFQKLRDALEESAPDLSIEEIKSQVPPDQMFSAALACLIFRRVRHQREEPYK